MTKKWTATKSNIQPKRLASKQRRADDAGELRDLLAVVRDAKAHNQQPHLGPVIEWIEGFIKEFAKRHDNAP